MEVLPGTEADGSVNDPLTSSRVRTLRTGLNSLPDSWLLVSRLSGLQASSSDMTLFLLSSIPVFRTDIEIYSFPSLGEVGLLNSNNCFLKLPLCPF